MKEQFDLFEQPPPGLARGLSGEQVLGRDYETRQKGHSHYLAAHELVHFTSYLKLNDWQQKYLWPHLQSLVEKIKVAESDHAKWFELGYIISAQEVEQIRSRSAALAICKKYGVEL